MAKKKAPSDNTIAQNRRARHEFFIDERLEAGVALAGWEVKSLRAGKGQLTDSYVVFHNGEAYLHNVLIQPLQTASTHFVTEPTRTRKLLLKAREIQRLREANEQKGYTILVLSLYWKAHLVKVEIAIAKGKQMHDKRDAEKDRDWARDKERTMREHNK